MARVNEVEANLPYRTGVVLMRHGYSYIVARNNHQGATGHGIIIKACDAIPATRITVENRASLNEPRCVYPNEDSATKPLEIEAEPSFKRVLTDLTLFRFLLKDCDVIFVGVL